jgi:hypothetical protein
MIRPPLLLVEVIDRRPDAPQKPCPDGEVDDTMARQLKHQFLRPVRIVAKVPPELRPIWLGHSSVAAFIGRLGVPQLMHVPKNGPPFGEVRSMAWQRMMSVIPFLP